MSLWVPTIINWIKLLLVDKILSQYYYYKYYAVDKKMKCELVMLLWLCNMYILYSKEVRNSNSLKLKIKVHSLFLEMSNNIISCSILLSTFKENESVWKKSQNSNK